MIERALGLLAKPWLFYGLAAVGVGLIAAAGVQTVRLGWAQTALEKAKTTLAEERAERERARREAVESAREWDRKLTEQRNRAEEEQRARIEETSRLAATVARLQGELGRSRVDTAGLRDELARARAAAGADDSLPACVAYGRALDARLAEGADLLREGQQLVAEGAQLAAELGEARDRFATQVTACVKTIIGESAK